MTSADSKSFLSNGGYLQKGIEVNVSQSGLENKVQDLLPGRLDFFATIWVSPLTF